MCVCVCADLAGVLCCFRFLCVAAGPGDSALSSVGLGMGTGENPRLVRPGSYHCVCVELDVAHLAVNTIINSTYINDIEGGDMGLAVLESGGADGAALAAGGRPLDDTEACAGAFRVLKTLVTNWCVCCCLLPVVLL